MEKRKYNIFVSGNHGGRVTPVPIPNTAVKPPDADGTASGRRWESRCCQRHFLFIKVKQSDII